SCDLKLAASRDDGFEQGLALMTIRFQNVDAQNFQRFTLLASDSPACAWLRTSRTISASKMTMRPSPSMSSIAPAAAAIFSAVYARVAMAPDTPLCTRQVMDRVVHRRHLMLCIFVRRRW